MKKLMTIIICMMIFLPMSYVYAEDWHKTNQVTLMWDATTTLEGDIPIPVGDVIKYTVFTMNKQTGEVLTVAQDISVTQGVITFYAEGFYWLGVRADRYIMVNGVLDTEPISSVIAWSNDSAYCFNGQTFGIRFHVPPGSVTNLNLQ